MAKKSEKPSPLLLALPVGGLLLFLWFRKRQTQQVVYQPQTGAIGDLGSAPTVLTTSVGSGGGVGPSGPYIPPYAGIPDPRQPSNPPTPSTYWSSGVGGLLQASAPLAPATLTPQATAVLKQQIAQMQLKNLGINWTPPTTTTTPGRREFLLA